MEHAPDAPVVVLSPHLDDALLSAFAVLRAPGEVTVVNVFAGLPEPGPPPRWDRVLRAADSRELVRERIAEDVEALAQIGRAPVNLAFLDNQYRDRDPEATELEAAIVAAAPRAAALHAPAGIRGHRDHELVRDLALALGRRGGIPVTLYAELPYAAYFGWPAWVTGHEPHERLDPEVDWEVALAGAPVERDSLVPRVVRLDPEAAGAKLRALRCYRTQFAALNRGSLGFVDHPDVLPFEVAWSVDGPGN